MVNMSDEEYWSLSSAELFIRCRNGDDKACRVFYIRHYLIPNMIREISRILNIPIKFIPPFPIPHMFKEDPDPMPLLPIINEQKLIRILAGDPEPQPSIINISEQVKILTEFRNALYECLINYDKRIKEMLDLSKNITKERC